MFYNESLRAKFNGYESYYEQYSERLIKDVTRMSGIESREHTEELLDNILSDYSSDDREYAVKTFIANHLIFISTDQVKLTSAKIESLAKCSKSSVQRINANLKKKLYIKKERVGYKWDNEQNRYRHMYSYRWIDKSKYKTFFKECAGIIWRKIINIFDIEHKKSLYSRLVKAIALNDEVEVVRQLKNPKNRMKVLKHFWLTHSKNVNLNNYKNKVENNLNNNQVQNNIINETKVIEEQLNPSHSEPIEPKSNWDHSAEIEEFFKKHHTNVTYLIPDDEVTNVPMDPNVDYTTLDWLD